MRGNKIAIIDIGSNSIRVVIYLKKEYGSYTEVYNFKVVARLSNNINENNELDEAGISTLLETLARFEQILAFHHVHEIYPVATAAIRNASNKETILKKIQQNSLLKVNVLTDYEEAYYGYLAVVNSTDILQGITIDIGGGSTEVTLFENRKLIHSHSFPFGAVTLKRRFMPGEKLTFEEREKLCHFLHNQFHSLPWLSAQKKPVIGIGGSARNLALIHQRQTSYPLAGLHQYEVPHTEMEKINDMLLASSLSELQQIEGLSKDRADIIGTASQAIQTLMLITESPMFIMSNKGLRDGVLLKRVSQETKKLRFSSVADESIFQLSRSFDMNEEHMKQVSALARKIRIELQPFIIDNKQMTSDLNLLEYSARLFSIGEFINKEASSEHTFYLLTNMTIDGLSHAERLAVAFISSFKSRARLLTYWQSVQRICSQAELNRAELLGSILKLSFNLNRTRQNVITDVTIRKSAPKQLMLNLAADNDPFFEEQYALKHKKHLERALGCKIQLHFTSNVTNSL